MAYHAIIQLFFISNLLVEFCGDLVPPLFHIPRCDNVFCNDVIPGYDALFSHIFVVYILLFFAVLEETGKIFAFYSLFFTEELISNNTR